MIYTPMQRTSPAVSECFAHRVRDCFVKLTVNRR
jgi:hypothetical protein